LKILEEKGYQYVKHLSTGGEGEIHLIKCVDKAFIAKIVPVLDEKGLRLMHSIRTMDIPGIPKIHEIFNTEDKTVIIREYIKGNTLYNEIQKNGSFTLNRAKTIILKICETLKAFHCAKPNPIIYRDLKPENVIVTPDGDIRLIDFGIARYYSQDAGRDTVLAGTKGYTAPEVMAGLQSDERSDVYSAGLLFYELLTGKNIIEPPYQIRPVWESNERLPAWLDTVIEKATEINQVNRYRSISEFAAALENPPKRKKNNRKGRVIAVAAIVILLALGTGIYLWFSSAGSYEMILEIDFDQEADLLWILGSENLPDYITLESGLLYIGENGCNIDFTPKPGMIVHYRVSMPQWGAVGLSIFRINAPLKFECLYFNEQEQRTYSTNDLDMEGLPFQNTRQFVDAIFYITPESDAVYAFAIDEEAKRIQYTAYQIPAYLQNETPYMEINHFSDTGSVAVDSVDVAEGSLAGYLSDHFASYRENQERVDAFLKIEVNALPEFVFY